MLWVASPELADEHNPYDPEGQALAEKKREGTRLSEKAQRESLIRWVMGHKRGREFVNQLLKDAGVGTDPFSPNATQMSRNTGLQRMGIDLQMVAKRVALKEFHEMELEHRGVND